MQRSPAAYSRAFFVIFLFAPSSIIHSPAQTPASTVGIFENHADVGTVLHTGSASYNEASKTYALSASGENMWFNSDAFQFVWKKVSGDVSLSADISFIGPGGNPHRKAVLMIRQSLDAGSVYADIALHGVGMTALQYRDEKSALTHEVIANISAPKRLQLQKRGEYFYMSLSADASDPTPSGASIRIPISGAFFVGIGLCSHDKDVVEKAVFSNVILKTEIPSQSALISTLETVAIASTERQIVYSSPGRFEAPNWNRAGDSLIFNRDGRLEKIPSAGGKPALIDTGFAIRCNNDHGISPDGTLLAISDNSQQDHQSLVYIVPLAASASGKIVPRKITQLSPSYWHGWSPDGHTLAFVGQRNGNFDIYSIPVTGGDETRLTTAPGLDDGPEYSPDGKFIYFNSERTGPMQLWRMKPDGSDQEQVTSDDFNNWFPHISPDGKWMVFLSYDKSVSGHPENKDVLLRLMSLEDKKISILAKLFGGQGTINVPSWSPDSKQLAFVSYALAPVESSPAH